MLVYNQIKNHVAECDKRIEDIKTPMQLQDEALKPVNAELEATWGYLFQTRDTAVRSHLQEKIQHLIRTQERLKIDFENGLADARTKYEREFDDVVMALCDSLFGSIKAAVS